MTKAIKTLFFITALFFIFFTAQAGAQNIKGKSGVGIRGGASLLSQDIAVGLEGKTGPLISVNILYGNTDILSTGLDIQWERHKLEVIGEDIGEASNVSLIPFVELRAARIGNLTPYASLGIGVNINSISVDHIPQTTFAVETTFAVKFEGGADYFVTQNLALNAEIGWKLNSGEVNACNSLTGDCVTDDWKISAFNALFGLRYYFNDF